MTKTQETWWPCLKCPACLKGTPENCTQPEIHCEMVDEETTKPMPAIYIIAWTYNEGRAYQVTTNDKEEARLILHTRCPHEGPVYANAQLAITYLAAEDTGQPSTTRLTGSLVLTVVPMPKR